MAKVLDYRLKVSKFDLQSRYYVHFQSWERQEPSYPFPAMG